MHTLVELRSAQFDKSVHFGFVGTTMISGAQAAGAVGHWRLKGGAITLAQLLLEFGEHFTAQELFFWYYHATKVAKKRAHAWGSECPREAAKVRKQVYGRYGHRHERREE